MASFRMKLMSLIMVIEVVMLGNGRLQSVWGKEACGNLVGLGVLFTCSKFIEKDTAKAAAAATAPSADCCGAIKSIGMNCTCQIVTKEIEQIISLEKLVSVAATCGQPLSPGTQCGSYKVPPVA